MNKEIARYRRALKRKLHCSSQLRGKLLRQFEDTLSLFLDDHPDTAYEQLAAAFGPPELMAEILMEKVPEKESRRYHQRRIIAQVFAGIAAALFVAFALYAYFDKEYSVVTVTDNLYPVETTSTLEGATQ